jgi:hypothetical protein
METMVFNAFKVLFRVVGVLIITGTLAIALGDLQKKALNSQHVGLVSLLSINQQLVGKTK